MRVIAQQWISLDGFASGPDGGEQEIFQAVPEAGQVATQEWNERLLDDVDVVMLGRRTYEMFAAYWPTSTEPIARRIDGVAKVVCSRSLETAPWGDDTPLAVERDPLGHLRSLRDEPAWTVLVWGSLSLVHQLLEADLLDELDLFVAPIVLGGGTPLVPSGRRLEQVDVEALPGAVHARYRL